MNFEYYFVPAGTTRQSLGAVNNEIWLDVGNRIELGTFDHHCDKTKYESTLEVFGKAKGFLKDTITSLDTNQVVRIYLHNYPDTDALFAAYIFQYCAQNGYDQFEKELLGSSLWNCICKYVNEIDRGEKTHSEEWTLYNLICRLDDNRLMEYWDVDDFHSSFYEMLNTGTRWVEQAITRLKENNQFDIKNEALFKEKDEDIEAAIIMRTVSEAEFKEAVDKKRRETKEANENSSHSEVSYEKDKKQGALIIKNVELWTLEGRKDTVKAAIWNRNPSDPSSSYLLARKEGAVITFVPNVSKDGTRRTKVSLNNNEENKDKYSLKEVGEFYEQMEQIYDKSYLKSKGIMRRNYSRPRGDGSSSVFMEAPFSYTSDPWYLSEKYDMVDSPRVGTELSISEMIEILENITKMVKRSSTVSYNLELPDESKNTKKQNKKSELVVKADCNKVADKQKLSMQIDFKDATKTSLFKWCEEVNKDINLKCGQNRFPLIIAEVDSQLLTYSYEILNALFMRLSNGAYLDADERSVLRLDYRTHLYVNQRNAVLFVASNEIEACKGITSGILEIENEEKVRKSSITSIFNDILYQREMLKEIGKFIGDFKKQKKNIKKNREDLIELLAWAQAKECLDTQIELDCYKFIASRLGVPELRESVSESMEMISDYTKEAVYGKLDSLSQFTIPFILVATVFQMGFLRFSPAIDLVEGSRIDYANIAAWIICAAITILVTWLFASGGRK